MPRTLTDLRAEVAAREAEEAARARRDVVVPAPVVVTPAGRPCAYPDTAILTAEEVAAVLGGISVKTLKRRGIKHRDGLYLYRDVVAYISEEAA